MNKGTEFTIDYSIMIGAIEDASRAFVNVDEADNIDDANFHIQQAIAHSVYAISVALAANHYDDEGPA